MEAPLQKNVLRPWTPTPFQKKIKMTNTDANTLFEPEIFVKKEKSPPKIIKKKII